MPSSEATFLDRLQAIFNILAGVSEVLKLPQAFSEQSDWELRGVALSIPAIWRRQCRLRV
jgi:hypothetical protein